MHPLGVASHVLRRRIDAYRKYTTTPKCDGVVESDSDRYKPISEEFDCVTAELVISAMILGEDSADLRERFAHVVRRKLGGSDIPVNAVRHSALGLRSEE
jgi:hypothetical protein